MPMQVAIQLSEAWKPAALNALPADVFAGGWVGYTSYDTVRYVYPSEYHGGVFLLIPATPSDLQRITDHTRQERFGLCVLYPAYCRDCTVHAQSCNISNTLRLCFWQAGMMPEGALCKAFRTPVLAAQGHFRILH